MVKNFEKAGFKPEVRTLASFQDDYGLKLGDDDADEEDEEDEEGVFVDDEEGDEDGENSEEGEEGDIENTFELRKQDDDMPGRTAVVAE